MTSNNKVIDLVTNALSDSSDEESINPPIIKRYGNMWRNKNVEDIDCSDDEKELSKTKSKNATLMNTQVELMSKKKPYIASNKKLTSPFPVSNANFATPNYSYTTMNTSVATRSDTTELISSSTSSTAAKRKTETERLVHTFNVEKEDPNKAIKMRLGVTRSNKKQKKSSQSPNSGLVIYLKRQAFHLALKSDYERKTKDELSYKNYNMMNATKLSEIAIMIKGLPVEIKKDPEGNYSWLKGVGDAFSYLIHSYFLVDEE